MFKQHGSQDRQVIDVSINVDIGNWGLISNLCIHMNTLINILVSSVVLVSLNACVGLRFESPETINLSGEWLLDQDLSQAVVFSARSLSKPRSKPSGEARAESRGGTRGSSPRERPQEDNVSQPNVLNSESSNASAMTIDHVEDSMGIMCPSGKY